MGADLVAVSFVTDAGGGVFRLGPGAGFVAAGGCQFFWCLEDGVLFVVDAGTTWLGSAGFCPSAAGLSFGISSRAGGGIGSCANGMRTSTNSAGVW
jgi:hypothetical protein